jgi:hypothetical protein
MPAVTHIPARARPASENAEGTKPREGHLLGSAPRLLGLLPDKNVSMMRMRVTLHGQGCSDAFSS